MDIQIFKHPQFGDIRCMKDDKGEPWFVGKDVASVLGYANPTKAVMTHVDDDDKLHSQIGNTGQMRDMLLINESGLYSLILGSKLPQAKEFKRWVTSEVLPQIRKTGGYIPVKDGDDEKMILCKALMIFKHTVEKKDKLLEEQRPKVEFAEALDASVGCIEVGALANILRQNGYDTGRRRLFKKLRELKYICKTSRRPMQTALDAGLFEVKVSLWTDTNGKDYEDVKPMVTPIQLPKYEEFYFSTIRYFQEKCLKLSYGRFLDCFD